MATPPFKYQETFPLGGKDTTEYYLLSKDYVSTANFEGQEILKVEPEALTLLAQHAFHNVEFLLRPEHQEQVAKILSDPEASDNDKFVALTFLRNSEISAKGILPFCRIRVQPLLWGKKVRMCLQVRMMKKPCREVYIILLPKIISVIRKMPRWICIKR